MVHRVQHLPPKERKTVPNTTTTPSSRPARLPLRPWPHRTRAPRSVVPKSPKGFRGWLVHAQWVASVFPRLESRGNSRFTAVSSHAPFPVAGGWRSGRAKWAFGSLGQEAAPRCPRPEHGGPARPTPTTAGDGQISPLPRHASSSQLANSPGLSRAFRGLSKRPPPGGSVRGTPLLESFISLGVAKWHVLG